MCPHMPSHATDGQHSSLTSIPLAWLAACADDGGHAAGATGGIRHSFVCHVDLDKALAPAKQLSQAPAAADAHFNTPKSSKKRDRSTREAEGGEGAAAEAGVSAGANFSMVHKYGPLLCAEFLTGHNLLLVERLPSPSRPFPFPFLPLPRPSFVILALLALAHPRPLCVLAPHDSPSHSRPLVPGILAGLGYK